MSWNNLRKNKKGLPNDEMLADLYALSRKAKVAEQTERPTYFAKPYYAGKFAQLTFITTGCKLGQCSFCSYGGNEKEITPEIVHEEMGRFSSEILSKFLFGKPTDYVLFDALGSIFDPNEFSNECLDALFEDCDKLVRRAKTIKSLDFETHYQTLGTLDENGEFLESYALKKLVEFKNSHPEISTTVIELGFESANKEIRDNLLFKPIDDEKYKKAIDYLHQNGIEVFVNVMANMPFLTKQEQIDTSYESLLKVLDNENGFGAENVCLFPLNIRKNTFYSHVLDCVNKKEKQDKDFQRPVWLDEENSIWSMVATLKKVVDSGHEDLLDKINIAWFGGREVYSNDVFPKDWEQIYDDLMMFRFNLSGDNSRKNIVNRLAETDGYKSYMESVKKEKQTSLSYRERAEYLHDFLEESSPMVAQSEIPVINM